MSRPWAAPAGFVARERGRATLVADPLHIDSFCAAGLDDPRGFEERLGRGAAGGPGRGPTAVLGLPDGLALRLKRLRRGGLLAPLWRRRFLGRSRLADNLRIPRQLRERGVRTPRVWALLAVEGPPGLYQAWSAAEEIPQAVDLRSRIASGRPPSREEWVVALDLVRHMHDAGLAHRDLNLGNLVLVERPTGTEALVLDLDGARLRDRPLGFRARQRALRRLERSYVKAARGAADLEVRRLLYTAYAGEDGRLAERLARGRRAAGRWIRLHALSWPR